MATNGDADDVVEREAFNQGQIPKICGANDDQIRGHLGQLEARRLVLTMVAMMTCRLEKRRASLQEEHLKGGEE